jgi:hypothetical protein
MPQNPHELAQVWEGFQPLYYADDAFNLILKLGAMFPFNQ